MNLSHYYIGIAMLTAGALSACGNILEEPSAAKAETGELCIELTTDANLEINTKSTESVQNILANQGTFKISMSPQDGTTVPANNPLPTTAGTHSNIPVGHYYISAKNNKTMSGKFDWDCPILASTLQTVDVNPGTQSKELTCTLQNSIIAVDANAWRTLLNEVDVTAFQVVDTANVPAKGIAISGGTSLLASGSTNTLNSRMLYADQNLKNVKIVLDGKLRNGTQKEFRAYAPIQPSTTNNLIGSKNKYNVSFSLDNTKGQLVLNIKVDSTVTAVPIVIPILIDGATTEG